MEIGFSPQRVYIKCDNFTTDYTQGLTKILKDVIDGI
jgi:hypothetical protein